jgi:hypothetical protein
VLAVIVMSIVPSLPVAAAPACALPGNCETIEMFSKLLQAGELAYMFGGTQWTIVGADGSISIPNAVFRDATFEYEFVGALRGTNGFWTNNILHLQNQLNDAGFSAEQQVDRVIYRRPADWKDPCGPTGQSPHLDPAPVPESGPSPLLLLVVVVAIVLGFGTIGRRVTA